MDLETSGISTKGLRTVPPGFSRGLRLPGEEIEDETLAELDDISPTNRAPLVNDSHNSDYLQFH